jgi:hypothetical protein
MSTTPERRAKRSDKARKKAAKREAKAATPKPTTHETSGATMRPPKWLRDASRSERDAYNGILAPQPRTGYGYLNDDEFHGPRWWNALPAGRRPAPPRRDGDQ